jgi:hypothetical protein
MRFIAVAKILLLVALLALIGLLAYAHLRRHPQDAPWTAIDPAHPIGLFTGRKLAALTADTPQCLAFLDRGGIAHERLPPISVGQCGYADGVKLASGGALAIAHAPPLSAACPVVAALAIWEWQVVQPAALRHFGQPVARIDNFGTYSCRRIGGGREGGWSEHATADAVDIAGFRLVDGRRITVAADWTGEGAEARFLHDVRDGACRLFATTLSPDYNAAHADHLHLDQAERGAMGWRGCR